MSSSFSSSSPHWLSPSSPQCKHTHTLLVYQAMRSSTCTSIALTPDEICLLICSFVPFDAEIVAMRMRFSPVAYDGICWVDLWVVVAHNGCHYLWGGWMMVMVEVEVGSGQSAMPLVLLLMMMMLFIIESVIILLCYYWGAHRDHHHHHHHNHQDNHHHPPLTTYTRRSDSVHQSFRQFHLRLHSLLEVCVYLPMVMAMALAGVDHLPSSFPLACYCLWSLYQLLISFHLRLQLWQSHPNHHRLSFEYARSHLPLYHMCYAIAIPITIITVSLTISISLPFALFGCALQYMAIILLCVFESERGDCDTQAPQPQPQRIGRLSIYHRHPLNDLFLAHSLTPFIRFVCLFIEQCATIAFYFHLHYSTSTPTPILSVVFISEIFMQSICVYALYGLLSSGILMDYFNCRCYSARLSITMANIYFFLVNIPLIIISCASCLAIESNIPLSLSILIGIPLSMTTLLFLPSIKMANIILTLLIVCACAAIHFFPFYLLMFVPILLSFAIAIALLFICHKCHSIAVGKRKRK